MISLPARHNVTPIMLEIALHYHIHPTEYRDGDFSAPAVRAALDLMVEKELLTGSVETGFESTPALTAYIGGLVSVPFPVKVWKIL